MYLLYQADLQSKITHPHFSSVLAAPAKFIQYSWEMRESRQTPRLMSVKLSFAGNQELNSLDKQDYRRSLASSASSERSPLRRSI